MISKFTVIDPWTEEGKGKRVGELVAIVGGIRVGIADGASRGVADDVGVGFCDDTGAGVIVGTCDAIAVCSGECVIDGMGVGVHDWAGAGVPVGSNGGSFVGFGVDVIDGVGIDVIDGVGIDVIDGAGGSGDDAGLLGTSSKEVRMGCRDAMSPGCVPTRSLAVTWPSWPTSFRPQQRVPRERNSAHANDSPAATATAGWVVAKGMNPKPERSEKRKSRSLSIPEKPHTPPPFQHLTPPLEKSAQTPWSVP